MSTLRLLAWNIKTGNPDARAAVRDLIRDHSPHVVALSEASSLRLPDGFCGYNVRQEKVPSSRTAAWFREPVSEHGEQAALFAPGVIVAHDRVVPMRQAWTGPVHGLLHQPRRNRNFRVRVDGQAWRLSLQHWATGGLAGVNGPAVKESYFSGRSFLRAGLVAPSVLVGDLNVNRTVLRCLFPDWEVAGIGPDNAVVRGARVTRTVLDHHGSDHPAVLYTITRTSAIRRRADSGR